MVIRRAARLNCSSSMYGRRQKPGRRLPGQPVVNVQPTPQAQRSSRLNGSAGSRPWSIRRSRMASGRPLSLRTLAPRRPTPPGPRPEQARGPAPLVKVRRCRPPTDTEASSPWPWEAQPPRGQWNLRPKASAFPMAIALVPKVTATFSKKPVFPGSRPCLVRPRIEDGGCAQPRPGCRGADACRDRAGPRRKVAVRRSRRRSVRRGVDDSREDDGRSCDTHRYGSTKHRARLLIPPFAEVGVRVAPGVSQTRTTPGRLGPGPA